MKITSQKFNINQKGTVQLIAAIVIVLGVLVGGYLVSQRTNYVPKANYQPTSKWSNPMQKVNQNSDIYITNDQQLMQTSQYLDNQDVDQLDKELEQVNMDSEGL